MATNPESRPAITELESGEALESTVGDDGVVLVDFHATWCGPCIQMEPVLEAIADTTDARVVKVDVDQHQHLAAQHQVRGVPTMLVYQDGEPVERFVGYQPEPSLRQTVEQLTA